MSKWRAVYESPDGIKVVSGQSRFEVERALKRLNKKASGFSTRIISTKHPVNGWMRVVQEATQ